MKESIVWKNGYEAALTLSFDDGYKDTCDLTIEVLPEYSMPATYNIITSYVGKTFFGIPMASWEQLEMASKEYSVEIASHSHTHEFPMVSIVDQLSVYLPDTARFSYTYETLKSLIDKLRPVTRVRKPTSFNLAEEFLLSKQEINKHIPTQRVKSFVYPGGHYTKQMRSYVKSTGYLSARGAVKGYNQPPDIDLCNLKCRTWGPSTIPSEANKWVDEVLDKGGWLIEAFHLVSRRNKYGYKFFTPFKHFKEHLDYISKKLIWIDTQQNIVEYLLKVDTKGYIYSPTGL